VCEDSSPSAANAEALPPPRPSYHDTLAPCPAAAARILKPESAPAARALTAALTLRSKVGFRLVSHPRQRVDDDSWTLVER
jgi:hypothetical protein